MVHVDMWFGCGMKGMSYVSRCMIMARQEPYVEGYLSYGGSAYGKEGVDVLVIQQRSPVLKVRSYPLYLITQYK